METSNSDNTVRTRTSVEDATPNPEIVTPPPPTPLDSVRVSSRCNIFISLVLVSALVLFETLFYFLYIAPVVERGNVKLSAERVVDQIFDQMETVTSDSGGLHEANIAAALGSAARSTEAPSTQNGNDDENDTTVNRRCILLTAAFLTVTFVVLFIYWWTRMRSRIRFPRDAMLFEVLPIIVVFAVYDFVYFTFFVKTWNSISAEEFMYELVNEALHPDNPVDP